MSRTCKVRGARKCTVPDFLISPQVCCDFARNHMLMACSSMCRWAQRRQSATACIAIIRTSCDSCVLKPLSCLLLTVSGRHRNAGRKEEATTAPRQVWSLKRWMHLSEREPYHRITRMHQSEVELGEGVINGTGPASFVGLLENAMNELATFQKAMGPDCSFQNIDCRMISLRDRGLGTMRELKCLWI